MQSVTTRREGLGCHFLEKIIYIADAIEPNRNYPGVDALREAAQHDLTRHVFYL